MLIKEFEGTVEGYKVVAKVAETWTHSDGYTEKSFPYLLTVKDHIGQTLCKLDFEHMSLDALDKIMDTLGGLFG